MSYPLDYRCDRCGCRYGQHRSQDDRCPVTVAWGRPRPLPCTDDQLVWFEAERKHWNTETTFKVRV